MTGDAQVPDEVVERLWSSAWVAAPLCSDTCADPDCEKCGQSIVRALVAHLRANPEDAAAVLGGSVEVDEEWFVRSECDGMSGLIDGPDDEATMRTELARYQSRPGDPWTHSLARRTVTTATREDGSTVVMTTALEPTL